MSSLKIIVIPFFILANVICTAQIGMDSLIAIVFKKPTLSYIKQNIDQYNTSKKGLTALENLEIRTQANGFEYSKLTTTVDFNINSLGQIKAQKNKEKTSVNILSTQIDKDVLESMAMQYQNIIDLMQLKETYALKKQLLVVLYDKRNLYINTKILEGEETLLHILRNDFDIKDLEYEIKTNEIKAKLIERKLLKYSENAIIPTISIDDLIAVDTIIQNIEKWDVAAIDNPYTKAIKANIADIEADMRIVSAESHKIVDQLRLRYRNFENKYFIREYTIGTSLLLPYKSSLNVRLSNKTVDLLSSKNKLYQYEIESREKLMALKQNINASNELYSMAKLLLENTTGEQMLKNLPENALRNPITLLYAKEIQINTIMKQIAPKYNILKSYIDLQTTLGNLTKLPLVNYLSKDLHFITVF
jgi:hypothetical protein